MSLDIGVLMSILKNKFKLPIAKEDGRTVGTSFGNANSLSGMMEEAFNNIGLSMMSDGFAAKLLAYVYVLGGGNEAVVYHTGLNAGIKIAQQKFNLYGGQVPNVKLLGLLQQRIKEIEANEKVEWLNEIYERYNLVTNGEDKKVGKHKGSRSKTKPRKFRK